MPAKIAILGWGSLLWEKGHEFDQWHEPWQDDGPALKIEFSRVSESRLGALTLVIDPRGSLTTVAWCISKRRDPEDAICDLRCREGTNLKNIGRVFVGKEQHPSGNDQSRDAIVTWAKAKKLDVVVWTDLKSNFDKEAGQPFSAAAAVSYVKTKLTPEGKAKAAEYVWRARSFVQTPVRSALQQEPWFSPPNSKQGVRAGGPKRATKLRR